MNGFQGFTKKITEKLSKVLRNPAVKEKEPIKESIMEQLKNAKKNADIYNEERKKERELQPHKPKIKKHDQEL